MLLIKKYQTKVGFDIGLLFALAAQQGKTQSSSNRMNVGFEFAGVAAVF